MSTIDLNQLTPEQKEALKKQFEAEQENERKAKIKQIENYKQLVEGAVAEHIKALMNASSQLSLLKAEVYKAFSTLIALKSELYGTKSGQFSHTFSGKDGSSITVGYRIIDKFDDTLDIGIAKVRDYIDSMAIDANSANLVDMINNLLKKDAKGNLKPSRILDLQNLAEKQNSELLTMGVEIIRASYKPQRSAIFIDADRKTETGASIAIPLSITSVDFPDGVEIDFSVFK